VKFTALLPVPPPLIKAVLLNFILPFTVAGFATSMVRLWSTFKAPSTTNPPRAKVILPLVVIVCPLWIVTLPETLAGVRRSPG
jgi:hypothetical protein